MSTYEQPGDLGLPKPGELAMPHPFVMVIEDDRTGECAVIAEGVQTTDGTVLADGQPGMWRSNSIERVAAYYGAVIIWGHTPGGES